MSYGFERVRKSAGLYNSTNFISTALNSQGIESDVIEVVDNNDIDREVSKYKPDVVIIEALWVVPEKFDVLQKLHPDVHWYVHLHSNIPFLSVEGIALDWIREYFDRNVGVIVNSKHAYSALSLLCRDEFDELVYLPNIYNRSFFNFKRYYECNEIVNVGCFGAIRPLKNQLIQAMAALKFAKDKKKMLYFYVNDTRIETDGEPVLKNLRHLFKHESNAKLIPVTWRDPEQFYQLLDVMNIGLQVSLSETFNVVTADYISAGLPVVVSKEIDWVSGACIADDNSVDDIVRTMHRVWNSWALVKLNQWKLKRFSASATKRWVDFILKCC